MISKITMTTPVGKSTMIQNGPYTHLVQHLSSYGGVLSGYVYGTFGIYYSYKTEADFRNNNPLVKTTNNLKALKILEDTIGAKNLADEVDVLPLSIDSNSRIYIFEHELVKDIKVLKEELKRNKKINVNFSADGVDRIFMYSSISNESKGNDVKVIQTNIYTNADNVNFNVAVVGEYGEILRTQEILRLIENAA